MQTAERTVVEVRPYIAAVCRKGRSVKVVSLNFVLGRLRKSSCWVPFGEWAGVMRSELGRVPRVGERVYS